MFDIEKYYELAHSGEKLTDEQNNEMITYVKSFAHVIIWGGSFLGKAIGDYLLREGVKIENYWDLRWEELKKVNDIDVIPPFSTADKENTLVIFCIGNNVIRGALLKTLRENQYLNVLRGDFLYEGTVCPFDKSTGIESKQCQGSMCCRAMFCERIENIVKKKCHKANPLSIYHVTLTINQICSLKCKCCTSYMNEYPPNKRTNIPLERIEKDIDEFFDSVDSVGSVTVMGGEPFIHPDISHIVQKLISKDNIGLICIATSGTFPIKDSQLDGLAHSRVNISFSNYEQSITEKQKKVMYESIEKVKEAGISYTVGVTMPEWIIPSTLYDKNMSENEMTLRKKSCTHPPRCMMIKDGKLHPCDFAAAVYGLGIADYGMDYVDLDSAETGEPLKMKIKEFMKQPYYRVCGHCKGFGLTAIAAEQGYMDFTQKQSFEKEDN